MSNARAGKDPKLIGKRSWLSVARFKAWKHQVRGGQDGMGRAGNPRLLPSGRGARGADGRRDERYLQRDRRARDSGGLQSGNTAHLFDKKVHAPEQEIVSIFRLSGFQIGCLLNSTSFRVLGKYMQIPHPLQLPRSQETV